MTPVNPTNVIVAGTPGAWINQVAKRLFLRGWHVLWPGQDYKVRDGELFLTHNSQNIEIQAINQALCDEHGTHLLSADLPNIYRVPYPGPTEFINKFNGLPVVISGTSLSPFLDMWASTARSASWICFQGTTYLLPSRSHHAKKVRGMDGGHMTSCDLKWEHRQQTKNITKPLLIRHLQQICSHVPTFQTFSFRMGKLVMVITYPMSSLEFFFRQK